MQPKKSGKCGTGDDRATQHHFHDAPAENRHSARDGCANSQSPICVLIEAQHLACKRHAQSHQQKKDTYDPGQLARKLVGAEKKDLHHVDENNRNHEIGAPPVQRADEPAKSDVVIQSLQTVPRLTCRWDIDQREQNSRDELQKEYDKRSAAEYVPPARRIARYWMLRGIAV